MRGARASVALVVLATAGLSGCLDFAEPEPGPGSLEADLDIRSEGPPRAAFRARFIPGGDADGTVRSVENPSIRILGADVEPSDGSGAIRWLYARTFDPIDGVTDRRTVEMVGPRLAGDRTRAVLAVPLVRRAGPDSVRVGAREPLELPVHGVPEASGGDLDRLNWTLRVRTAERAGLLFTAAGAGSLPDTLRVPEEALGGASGALEAYLDADLEAADPGAAPTAGYGAELEVTVRLAWTIVRG